MGKLDTALLVIGRKTFTLGTRYSEKTTTVKAKQYLTGACYITRRQKRAAERRLQLIGGDYLLGCDGNPDDQGEFAVTGI